MAGESIWRGTNAKRAAEIATRIRVPIFPSQTAFQSCGFEKNTLTQEKFLHARSVRNRAARFGQILLFQ
jgi:hypothetical protein